MSEPNFPPDLDFEVKNSEENKDLNNKTPLTNNQDVIYQDVLAEKQRSIRTVKKTNLDVSKFVKFIQKAPHS